jgi:DNA-binding NarL/FixJ family response regulator
MPDGSGTELCNKLMTQYPELKIIILTSHYEPVIIKQSLDAGALGYILKNAMSEEIIEGIQIVASGERFLCEETSKLLKRHENDTIVLTRREQELLRLVVAGKSSNEIADCMYLSFETIRTYRRNLMLKLNVNNTAQLVKMAMEQQLV